jgi:hypothetical protein
MLLPLVDRLPNKTIDNTNIINRINNICLYDIIKEDKYLLLFFNIIGYYQYNDIDHISIVVISRLWQIYILTFGAIGFFSRLSGGINGVYDFFRFFLYEELSTESFIFYSIFLFNNFIVPLLQVASLIYGIIIIRKQYKQSIITDQETICRLLLSCKRDAIVFFIVLSVVVIATGIYTVIIIAEDLNASYNNGYISNNFKNTKSN